MIYLIVGFLSEMGQILFHFRIYKIVFALGGYLSVFESLGRIAGTLHSLVLGQNVELVPVGRDSSVKCVVVRSMDGGIFVSIFNDGFKLVDERFVVMGRVYEQNRLEEHQFPNDFKNGYKKEAIYL